MSTPPHDAPTGSAPSLLPVRIAALVGALIAAVGVVVAFRTNLWLGVAAVFVSPGIPMLFVLGAEAARR